MNIEDRRNLSRNGVTAVDMDRWRHIIEEKINCDKNDINCWKRLLPQLPCDLADTPCWKSKYPTMPCNANDQDCWKQLLPELPCRLHDDDCWRRYHIERVKQFSPSKKLTASNISTTMINDTESIWLV